MRRMQMFVCVALLLVVTAGLSCGHQEETKKSNQNVNQSVADVVHETTFTFPGGAKIEMVWIEPGTFTMGVTVEQAQDDWFYGMRCPAHPAHPVTISRGFWLGKYELTQGQWESVMGTRSWEGRHNVQEGLNYPAVYILWNDVQEFIGKLNRMEGSTVFRLPTEAEWEYACRAGTTTLWSFGDDVGYSGEYAWYYGNTCEVRECYAHEVGMKLPNAWGLYDMCGNVWEWVQGRFRSYSGGAQTDPIGPSTGGCVTRGGSFFNNTDDMRSAYRNIVPASSAVGTRLVRQEP